jgi:uncharacterized membrane protein
MITDTYIHAENAAPSAGLSFVLRPNVSLSDRGFSILIICFAAISLVAGGFFWALGAWPVFGFFGLDVILLYVFFKLNYRHARRHEKIELKNDRLTVTQVSATGQERSWHFNPYWVRLTLEREGAAADEIGSLILSSHGKYVCIGGFLSPDERAGLAGQLRNALSSHKAPETVH